MARPTNPPGWATNGGTTRVEPSAGKRLTGYGTNEVPTAQELNAVIGGHGDWITHLDGEATGLALLASHYVGDCTGGAAQSIACNDSGSIIVTASGPSGMSRSTNGGITWTAFTLTGEPNRVDFANGVFLANNGSINLSRRSTDGVTWTEGSSSVTDAARAFAYSPALNRWAAVGAASAYYSNDNGATWTRVAIPGSPPSDLRSLAWSAAAGCFVACQVNPLHTAGALYRSADGITWTAISIAGLPFAGAVSAVDLSAAVRFVAVLHDNPATGNRIYTSADGITWTHRQTYALGSGIAYPIPDGVLIGRGALAIACGALGQTPVSVDGIAWTLRGSLPLSSACRLQSGVASWIGGSSNGRIYRGGI